VRWREVSSTKPPSAQPPLDADETDVWVETELPEAEYARLAEWFAGREEVWLHLRQHGAPDLSPLRHFPGLRRLVVTNLRLKSWDGIEHVADSLEHIGMGDTTLNPVSVAPLGCLTRLKSLGLNGPVKHGEVVGSLTTLEHLTLRSVRIDHASVMPNLTGLTTLNVHLGSADPDLSWLAALPRLAQLEIWRVRGVTDVRPLGDLSAVRRLSLQSMRGVTSLPSFSGASSLTRVALDAMKGITDLGGLADAPALEELWLVDMPQLEPEALRPLVGHPTLKYGVWGLGSVRKNDAAHEVLPLPPPESSGVGYSAG
jgi:internalin A